MRTILIIFALLCVAGIAIIVANSIRCSRQTCYLFHMKDGKKLRVHIWDTDRLIRLSNHKNKIRLICFMRDGVLIEKSTPNQFFHDQMMGGLRHD